jgi:altronate hydrolase
MFQRMKNDMDINRGPVIDGEATLQDMGQQIFELILRTASGQKSKSEIVGMGENEFTPWPIGVLA